jgi:outer membrane immunogenic protein
MKTPNRRAAALLALTLVCCSFAGVACAQSDNPWDGFYVGPNVGGSSNHSCNTWTASGTGSADLTSEFENRNCPSGSLIFGLQAGENFQYKRLLLGLGVDLEGWSAKNHNQSLTYTGDAPPPAGTYVSSGKLNPSALGIIGPRIGYAGNLWLPYVTAGALITGGSHDSTLSYTPTGGTKPTATFNGGKNFSTTGWAAGGGVEIGLNGAWSISAEYLHLNLGKGSSSAASCTGTAAACAAFSDISLESAHSSFSANLFLIGVNYYFSYWTP